MLSYLESLSDIWGPFRLFGFLTFRAMLAGGTGLVVGWLVAPALMRYLKGLKMREVGRTAAEVGELAKLHQGKKDTPTMGGLIIACGFFSATLLWARPNIYVLTALLVFGGLMAVGFVDDYLKVSKKNSRGLAGKYKLIAQAGLTLLVLLILSFDAEAGARVRELWIPFYKNPVTLALPWILCFVLLFLILAGSSNAINLTDGIDGLAIGCTVSALLAFAPMAYFAGNSVISEYLFLSYLPGTGELAVLGAGLLGASLAFLWYNSHPAEVFMGDTGSLALGGVIGVIAFMIHQPFTLVIVGGIFVGEAASVMIQVASYKSTRKRVFLMSPIHHHFELKGWHENKVVIRFWILSLLFSILGLASLKLR